MAEAVLDASALLAYLQDEPGADAVEVRLTAGAAISTVNWSEVLAKVMEAGAAATERLEHLVEEGGGLAELLAVTPFLRRDAERAAALQAVTRSRGLSLGDRACLALADRLGVPAVTADRAWLDLDIAVDILSIR